MSHYIRNVFASVRQLKKNPFFGFIQGHEHIRKEDLLNLKQMIGYNNLKVIEEFEHRFANIIGNGQAVSFAAGRMGFFTLMQALNIQTSDEIILQGATCSVMANAILRIGATPVYADIDPETFGSSADAINSVITDRTKLIVAQHSFGIPCDIISITKLAQSSGIFVLEDCALTLGSSIDGKVCGSFGDAALFSTDHSKPINTLIGGIIYTEDKQLFKILKDKQNKSEPLLIKKQKDLWTQFLFEKKYNRPDRYGRVRLLSALRKRVKFGYSPFLDEDFGSNPSTNYPYPMRLPAFLAALGLKELDNWSETILLRKKLLKTLMDIIENKFGCKFPEVYRNPTLDIVPLRIVFSPSDGKNIRDICSEIIETSWTWFMTPIAAASEPLINYGYHSNSCPISESIGKKIVNLPCNININWQQEYREQLEKQFSRLYSKTR